VEPMSRKGSRSRESGVSAFTAAAFFNGTRVFTRLVHAF